MRCLIVLVLLVALALPVAAQETPPVTADTVATLERVTSIDFAALPEAAGTVESGGFALSRDGSLIAVRNNRNAVVVLDAAGAVVDVFAVPGEDGLADTVLDTAFNRDGTLLAALVSDGMQYGIAVRDLTNGLTIFHPFINSPDIPLRVWFEPDSPFVWLEVSSAEPGQPGYTARMAYALPGMVVDRLDLHVVPGGPSADPDAFSRFGRIAPPFAVTSSQDGLVKLWNLETGEVRASARIDVAVPVFGGVDPSGRYLAWRDPDLQALHLLDFETGEDRVVAELKGEYASYIIVPAGGDVILNVFVDDAPVIVAYDSAIGERTVVGEYRACGRSPDMARLSGDSATLVIGCDTGLDVWRIRED